MRLLAWLPLALVAALSSEAWGANEKPWTAINAALDSVQRGAFDEAIDRLELLADRGLVHPDASAARAYAYVERARSRGARPGDLGRTAAALEEARALDPDDSAAETALEQVRAEIARRRARQGSSPLVQRPTLGRAVTALLSENLWAILAAFGSALLTAGLLLKRTGRRGAEIAGAVAIATGLVFGMLGAGFAAAAWHYRTSSRPAVVVVPEARLLDIAGRALPARGTEAEGVPEGALVHVREQREDRAWVEWGSTRAWVQSAQLRLIADKPGALP